MKVGRTLLTAAVSVLAGCSHARHDAVVGPWRLAWRATVEQGRPVERDPDVEEPPELTPDGLRLVDAEDATPATAWVVLARDGSGAMVNSQGEPEEVRFMALTDATTGRPIPAGPSRPFRWERHGRWLILTQDGEEDVFVRLEGGMAHAYVPEGLRGDWVFRRDPHAPALVLERALRGFPEAPPLRRRITVCDCFSPCGTSRAASRESR